MAGGESPAPFSDSGAAAIWVKRDVCTQTEVEFQSETTGDAHAPVSQFRSLVTDAAKQEKPPAG